MNKALIITTVLAFTMVVGIWQYMSTNNTTVDSTTNVQAAPAAQAAPVVEQDDKAAQLALEEQKIQERQKMLRESAARIR